MEILALIVGFYLFYLYGKHVGRGLEEEKQQNRIHRTMHNSLIARNSPSIRITWRCFEGECTLEEMMEELRAL